MMLRMRVRVASPSALSCCSVVIVNVGGRSGIVTGTLSGSTSTAVCPAGLGCDATIVRLTLSCTGNDACAASGSQWMLIVRATDTARKRVVACHPAPVKTSAHMCAPREDDTSIGAHRVRPVPPLKRQGSSYSIYPVSRADDAWCPQPLPSTALLRSGLAPASTPAAPPSPSTRSPGPPPPPNRLPFRVLAPLSRASGGRAGGGATCPPARSWGPAEPAPPRGVLLTRGGARGDPRAPNRRA